MDWMMIASAAILAAMLVYLFPRAKAMLQNSPKGSSSDWTSAMIPLVLVLVFVVVLVKMV